MGFWKKHGESVVILTLSLIIFILCIVSLSIKKNASQKRNNNLYVAGLSMTSLIFGMIILQLIFTLGMTSKLEYLPFLRMIALAIFLIIVSQSATSEESNSKSVTSIVGVGYTAAVIAIIYSLIHAFRIAYHIES